MREVRSSTRITMPYHKDDLARFAAAGSMSLPSLPSFGGLKRRSKIFASVNPTSARIHKQPHLEDLGTIRTLKDSGNENDILTKCQGLP